MSNNTGKSVPWQVAILSVTPACLLLAVAVRADDIQGSFIANLSPSSAYQLHFTRDSAGALAATIDLPKNGRSGLACSDIVIDGNLLSFKVQSIHASWTGTIQENGTVLDGQMSIASATPSQAVTFQRDTFVPAPKPSPVDGYWFAIVERAGQSLRTQIAVRSDAEGRQYCTYDSLDQASFAAECTNVEYEGRNFSFEVPEFRSKWIGRLGSDGRSLTGTWMQAGQSRAMNFERRSSPQPPPLPPLATR